MDINWTNKTEDMSTEDKYTLHEYRISQLEAQHAELKGDITQIKDVLLKLDKKLAVFPEGGFACQIHTMRMNDLEKKIDKLETVSEKMNKKIVYWSGAFAVVLFVISQLAVPYMLKNSNLHVHSGSEESATTHSPSAK